MGLAEVLPMTAHPQGQALALVSAAATELILLLTHGQASDIS